MSDSESEQSDDESVVEFVSDAEIVERLEQRVRSFRIRRDRYLQPLPDWHLVARVYPQRILDDELMGENLGIGSPAQDFCMVYGPKDGDYRNLQLFASSLVRFDDDDLGWSPVHRSGVRLCLFLALPQGCLVLLNWLEYHVVVEDDGVVVNGAPYSCWTSTTSALMEAKSLGEIDATPFLPPGRTISQHEEDVDMLLSFMTSLIVPQNGPLDEPEFLLQSYRYDDNGHAVILPTSSDAFRSSMEALVSAQATVNLYAQFSEEQWQLFQSMPFQAVDVDPVVLGTQFLHQTPAKRVCLSRLSSEEVRSALIHLRMRQQPIGVVDI